jgi:hypothetical protein
MDQPVDWGPSDESEKRGNGSDLCGNNIVCRCEFTPCQHSLCIQSTQHHQQQQEVSHINNLAIDNQNLLNPDAFQDITGFHTGQDTIGAPLEFLSGATYSDNNYILASTSTLSSGISLSFNSLHSPGYEHSGTLDPQYGLQVPDAIGTDLWMSTDAFLEASGSYSLVTDSQNGLLQDRENQIPEGSTPSIWTAGLNSTTEIAMHQGRPTLP